MVKGEFFSDKSVIYVIRNKKSVTGVRLKTVNYRIIREGKFSTIAAVIADYVFSALSK